MDGTSTSLPVTRYAKDILETVKLNPITIVIGETGSGKTTQIAQASILPFYETPNPGGYAIVRTCI